MLLGGDLDTIVLKALAREPGRRYGRAARSPTISGAISTGVRFSRAPTARLSPAGSSSGGIAWWWAPPRWWCVALIGGIAVSLWQARIARLEAAKATAIQKFVFGLFEVNRVRNPDGAKARETTAEELLKLAAGELEKAVPATAAQREVHFELEDTIADLLADLGLNEEAARLWGELARDLERRAPDAHLAEVLVNRGISANLVGRAEEARADFERALAILDGVGDRTSVLRGWALYNLGQYHWGAPGPKEGREEELFRSAIAVLEPHGPSHQLANAHYGLGRVLESRSEPEGAKSAFRAGIAVADAAPGIARTVVAGGYQQLSRVQTATQDFAGAEESIRRAMAVFEEFAGKEHRLTFEAENDLGRLLDATDRPVEAVPHLERALADRLKRLGPLHWSSVSTGSWLALARLNAGDVASALAAAAALDHDIAADRRLVEDRGGIVAWVHARALLIAGKADLARAVLTRAEPLLLTRHGKESPWLVEAGLLAAEIALAGGDLGEAGERLAAIPTQLTGAVATDARRARLEILRSAVGLELGDLSVAGEAAAKAVAIAARDPGRQYRRLAEAAAWRAVAAVAGRSGRETEARTAAASSLALYRAALLPGSSRLRELERELDRSTPLADIGTTAR